VRDTYLQRKLGLRSFVIVVVLLLWFSLNPQVHHIIVYSIYILQNNISNNNVYSSFPFFFLIFTFLVLRLRFIIKSWCTSPNSISSMVYFFLVLRHDATKFLKGRKPGPTPIMAKFPCFVNFAESTSRDDNSTSPHTFIYIWSSRAPN
jgi:hypothetical protein